MTTGPAPAPRTPAGGAGLAALITAPDTALIALDYDGTLSPIVSRPADAMPAPGAVEALRALAARVGTCAIITGRPVDALLELTGLANGNGERAGLENLTVLGQYGLQRWDGATGATTSPEPLPGIATVRSQLPEVLRDAPPGVTVEDKTQALVIHVRRAANPDAALGALAPALRRLAEENGLEAAPGKRVLELRPPNHDKGRALRELVEERTARSVLVAGDDLGDLPAFDAVDELRGLGIAGLTVCSDGPEVPAALRERADLVVDGPLGVVTLLNLLAARIG
ncbi:trehalose-phosphatase [Frankia sp. CNm7]|uniref:Trehalose 6-phosphate phosphatase n=1 Tax=Frankia nepalensis TaxID=1836974 RepID=A0A937R697_9ACTN|nr:trehalose-phosphatase [Frankia nepalensis]MBL7494707.1 trehalose-phosphatase [Frankia nepalensis]MBL7514128.1 trehalose-phosphatase [Frankia nepalensis]MBL7523386.1 trehalose-phosphatase [Frankia nepalensis]MBL7626508.1 trehalose-phosphatase [Frankia nepalensis]